MQPSREGKALDQKLELEAGRQDVLERSNHELVLADGERPHAENPVLYRKMPMALAALVTALSLEAANHLLAVPNSVPPGARVALASVDRAGQSLDVAGRLARREQRHHHRLSRAQRTPSARWSSNAPLPSLRGGASDVALGVVSPGPTCRFWSSTISACIDVVIADADESGSRRLAERFASRSGRTRRIGADASDTSLRAIARAGSDAVLVRPDQDARAVLLAAASI